MCVFLQDETICCLLLLQTNRFHAGTCSGFPKKETFQESITYVFSVQSLARGICVDMGSYGSDGFPEGGAVLQQQRLGPTTRHHAHVHRGMFYTVYDLRSTNNLRKLPKHDGHRGGKIPNETRNRST